MARTLVSRQQLETDDAGAAVIVKLVQGTNISLSSTGVDSGTGDVTVALASPVTSPLIDAHTATAGTAMKHAAGTLMTTAEAGALEFSTEGFFETVDTTNGRTQDCNQNIFRLSVNGAVIGPTIADFFGANSSLPIVTNGIYELMYDVFFLKTTAGTVTWTIANTQAYANIVALWIGSTAGGMATVGNTGGAGIVTTTTAAAVLPVSVSLTTAVNHRVQIRALAECATAGNIRLRVTSSLGTVTPLRGSYYTARRISGNVGTFVA